MDINQSNFWSSLPMVLKAISEATYVAFDLEMTGIKSKLATNSLTPTIDEVYHQAKDSAERYQILQIGLTCIRHDKLAKAYTTQSFNFSITPMFAGNDSSEILLAKVLDRTVSFSYRSMLFLKSHGFQLEQAFKDGVYYLSRHEVAELNDTLLQNGGGQQSADQVDIVTQDQETRKFYGSARSSILSWLGQPERGHFVNISNPHGGRLNRLQTRLIFQLVQTEFPACKAYPKCSNLFMQVVMLDAEREEKHWKKEVEERKAAVARQSGFRLVIEALVGGDFAKSIDPQWLVTGKDKASLANVASKLAQDLKQYEATLKAQPPILVGHNQLFDLCFIFQTFIGPLPATVDAFRCEIHALFPRIADTKHLGSRDDHAMVGDENLEELFGSVRDQYTPVLIHEAGFGYDRVCTHQAGYDSWMTSVLFVKLSWKLAQDPTNLAVPAGPAVQSGSLGYTTNPATAVDAPGASSSSLVSRSSKYSEARLKHAFAALNPFSVLGQNQQTQVALRPAAQPAPEQALRVPVLPVRGTREAQVGSSRDLLPAPPMPPPSDPEPDRHASYLAPWCDPPTAAPGKPPPPPPFETSSSLAQLASTWAQKAAPGPASEHGPSRAYRVDSWRNQPPRAPERFPACFSSIRPSQQPREAIAVAAATPTTGRRRRRLPDDDDNEEEEEEPRRGLARAGGDDWVLPAWDTAFWGRFGNKLRVGGSGVLDLSGAKLL